MIRMTTAAALAALMLTPAALAQQAQTREVTGYIGASYEYSEIDTPAGDAESNGVSINGSIVLDPQVLDRNFGVQLDAAYITGDNDSDTIAGAAHAFRRDEQWLWGGYVAAADVEDVGVLGFGGEINRYYENLTLAGTGGWTLADDLDTDVFSLAGEARYFLNPNTRVDAGMGWADIDVGDVAAEDAILLSLGGEHQFARRPFSVFAGLTTALFDDDVDSTQISVGLRYNFGMTLKDRDRSGPSLGQAPLANRLIF